MGMRKCAEVRDYVVEHLRYGESWPWTKTSFLKRGEESVGVGRQYRGLTGAEARTVKLSVSRAVHQLEGAELD